jgi:hypothetical protein
MIHRSSAEASTSLCSSPKSSSRMQKIPQIGGQRGTGESGSSAGTLLGFGFMDILKEDLPDPSHEPWRMAIGPISSPESRAHPDNAPFWKGFGVAMSSSPWEWLWNGDEDVATPFLAGVVSRSTPGSGRCLDHEIHEGTELDSDPYPCSRVPRRSRRVRIELSSRFNRGPTPQWTGT